MQKIFEISELVKGLDGRRPLCRGAYPQIKLSQLFCNCPTQSRHLDAQAGLPSWLATRHLAPHPAGWPAGEGWVSGPGWAAEHPDGYPDIYPSGGQPKPCPKPQTLVGTRPGEYVSFGPFLVTYVGARHSVFWHGCKPSPTLLSMVVMQDNVTTHQGIGFQ